MRHHIVFSWATTIWGGVPIECYQYIILKKRRVFCTQKIMHPDAILDPNPSFLLKQFSQNGSYENFFTTRPKLLFFNEKLFKFQFLGVFFL
jgi:hypothetical protein